MYFQTVTATAATTAAAMMIAADGFPAAVVPIVLARLSRAVVSACRVRTWEPEYTAWASPSSVPGYACSILSITVSSAANVSAVAGGIWPRYAGNLSATGPCPNSRPRKTVRAS
jgi:hypothetical protein